MSVQLAWRHWARAYVANVLLGHSWYELWWHGVCYRYRLGCFFAIQYRILGHWQLRHWFWLCRHWFRFYRCRHWFGWMWCRYNVRLTMQLAWRDRVGWIGFRHLSWNWFRSEWDRLNGNKAGFPRSRTGCEESGGTLYRVLDRLAFSGPSLVCVPVLASQTYVPAMDSGTV